MRRRMGLNLAALALGLAMTDVASAEFQRIRVESGSYTIGGDVGGIGGVYGYGTSIPGRCIDSGRSAGGRGDTFRGFSDTIRIRRATGGVPIGPSIPLSEASEWVRVSGDGDSGVRIEPLDPKDEFVLEVAPGGGLVGPTQDDVDTALAYFRERPGVLDGQQRLETLRTALADATQGDEEILRRFRSGNSDVEWAWLNPDEDPAQLLNSLQRRELAPSQ